MTVKSSMIIADSLTVFQVSENLPTDAFYVIVDGKKYELFPVYGSTIRSYAIKGKHDLLGKNVHFAGKDGAA